MHALTTRWLGVGLASALSVLTLGLAVTGRLSLYINPDAAWFAIAMSIVVLVAAIASCFLPLGREEDHGHDHADSEDAASRHPMSLVAVATGGVLASGVVLASLALPPTSLSPELASSRASTTPILFGGADVVTLATTSDTSAFGVGEWATVFATATDPAAFDGEDVALTGFVRAADNGDEFLLSRYVITHCVIDAQPAAVPVAWDGPLPGEGQWVDITGTVRAGADGQLRIVADTVQQVPEPEDPYEF